MLNAAQIDTAKLETLSEIELRELAATLLARIDRDAREITSPGSRVTCGRS